MIDAVLDPERQALVAAVHRRRRGIDEMAASPRGRQLEHVAMADEVRLNIGLRVLEAVADPRLRAEVDDAVEVLCIGEPREGGRIGEVDALEGEGVAEVLLQPREPRLLQHRIVIIVEVVDPDDLVAAVEQRPRGRRSDEPSRPRDQYRHGAAIGGAAAARKSLERVGWSAAGPSPSTAAGPSPTSSRAHPTGG